MAEIKKTTLFSDTYFFKGEHARKARELSNEIDKSSGISIFRSAVELYIAATVVGLHYNRREQFVPSEDQPFRIDVGQFIGQHFKDLDFIYKLVMLTYPNEALTPEQRINNAFRYSKDECEENTINMKVFEEYMLGGVSILYDHFINDNNQRYSEYLNSLNSLISGFYSENDEEDEDIDFDTPEF